MTTADQLAIVNRLLQAPAEAYTLAQVPAAFFPVPFSSVLYLGFYLPFVLLMYESFLLCCVY
jgi:hypothetical protein